jgi:valyl-tRNA synthetase
MIMMGIDCVGKVPFAEVYIYATVLTEDGRRMSKSLGTGVDPMEVIEKVGADALRFTLFSQTGHNQDIRYSEKRTEEARNFCNKIWNAVRFVMLNVDSAPKKPSALEDVDHWLLSRLYVAERAVREAYESYDIQAATQALYRFFWSELCDWYIEVSKPRLADPEAKNTPQWVLLTCIESFLIMMHPIMPHITEEVYSRLPIQGRAPFIMQAAWPRLGEELHRPEVVARVEKTFEVVRALRALRAELGIAAMKTIPAAHIEGDLGEGAEILKSQGWIQAIAPGRPETGSYVSSTVQGIDIHLPIGDLVDKQRELDRLAKESERVSADLAKLEERLNNPAFVERAKPEVIDRDRNLAAELREKKEKIGQRIELFGG